MVNELLHLNGPLYLSKSQFIQMLWVYLSISFRMKILVI